MKLYNLGSVNVDCVYAVEHIVTAGETLSSADKQIFPGGKGLNQSVALARAGAKILHGTLIGNDGAFLMERMAASGVEVSRIKRVDGSCGQAIIQVDRHGQNSILLYPGTNHRIDRQYAEEFLVDAEAGDLLLLQNEISALGDIFAVAAEKRLPIAFNPSPFAESLRRLPLQLVQWWFCNELEGAALFGSADPKQMGEAFLRMYPDSHLILTLGADGSLFVSREQTFFQPAYPTQAVDTTAAGDTFTGYFLAAILQGKSCAYAMERAAKAASVTVSRKGASDSIPYARELD